MLHLENPMNILIGGLFQGDHRWRSNHRNSDNCFKLYYLSQGEVYIEEEGQLFTLTSQRLYLINGYKMKNYRAEAPFETHWLHFSPQNLSTYRALYSLPVVTELPPHCLEEGKMNQIYGDSTNIFTLNCHNVQAQIRLHHHLLSVVLEVLRGYDWEVDLHYNSDKRIELALEFIHQNYDKGIVLNDIAKACHLSANHLHKLFSTALHHTPNSYLTQIRMNKAIALLSQCISVKEIAYQLGYCNDAHFSRTFKKYYGFPPRVYRSGERLDSELALLLREKRASLTQG